MLSTIIPACDTLRILHLPPQLSDDRRHSLLQRYGAIKTRTLRPSSKYTVTFAKFGSQRMATDALLHLHQLNVKGQYLSVEYAKKSIPLVELSELEPQYEPSTDDIKAKTTSKTDLQAFQKKLNSWSMNHMFSQPPLPNIKYKYMAPTKNTLMRIAIQLWKEPAFYTQVLHLMNKMNLPPPFKELEDEFPMLRKVYNMKKYKNIFGNVVIDKDTLHEEQEEEEESEIESDAEDNVRPVQIIPIKRKLPQPVKRLKIPKFVNPIKNIATSSSAQKIFKPEDLFEAVQIGETKNLKIELKTLDTSLDTVSATQDSVVTVDGGFGLIFPANKAAENVKSSEESEPKNKFITTEELEANRISTNDQRVFSVFKNYHPGKPSNRLYIKNLAKQVEEKDLHYIYRRYVIAGLKDAENEYHLRLMQEGRMKGQAFITLQNNVQAQMALDETNGYILKDKPMVVQFAKGSKS